jgi:hypothetical protein
MTDKGQKENFNQSDLMGLKPFSSIGPGRTTAETMVVKKLKNKKASQLRAKGSTFKEGIEANAGKVSAAMGSFARK